MKKRSSVIIAASAFVLLVAPAVSVRAQTVAREAEDGPYTFAYEFFRGDYAENASVYARLWAALRKAGIGPTRSLAFFLDDPATTRAEDRRCVCGVVIDERDWPKIEGLDSSFRIQRLKRAKRIVVDYPIVGPESYAEGGARCYPELERYCRQKGYTPQGSFEVYDGARNVISYVVSALELESNSVRDAELSGNTDSGKTAPADWPTRGWRKSTPEAQGMDSRELARILDSIPTMYDPDDIDSFLIVRHGWIVAEVYFSPNGPAYRHELHSVTKSVLGALVGVAVRKGTIRGIDERALSYFPDLAADAGKEALTIGHLLNMTSGLEFQEYPLNSPTVTHGRMVRSDDWAAFALGLPMAAPPGARFNYSDADVSILAAVLRNAVGEKVSAFASRELFRPLGITDFEWRDDPQGNAMGNDGLFLAPRDLAKIGYLYLRNGMWDGERILPEDWALETSKPAVRTGWADPYYSRLWWVDPAGEAYAANGSAGQMLIVMPRRDIVAVVTAKHPMSLGAPSFIEVANELILPAIKSDSALSEDPEGFKLLAARIARFEKPPRRAVSPLPDTAKLVSGERIDLEPNDLGLKQLELSFKSGKAALKVFSPKPFTIPIGLDGAARISGRTGRGFYASKGYWEDERTFVIESRILEGDFSDRIRLSFSGDRVTVDYIQSDELWLSLSIQGRIEGRTPP